MFSEALEAGVSTSRSTGPKGELTEPMFDFCHCQRRRAVKSQDPHGSYLSG